MHFEVSSENLTAALVIFGIWLLRLEGKVRAHEKDLNGLGGKFYKQQSEIHEDLTVVKVSLARVETRLGIKLSGKNNS